MRRPADRIQAAAGAIPPTGLILASILSVQVGAAIAKSLFPALGPGGAVFLRIALGALMLLAAERPRWRGYTRSDYAAAVLFGIVVAFMNLSFYAAIARLPLGIVVTLEFVGPLGVAVLGSRRRLDALWGGLAAAGILLLAPFGGTSLDHVGVGLALLAGCGWAAYILLNARVGRAFRGGAGLTMAMAVAALVVLPLGTSDVRPLIVNPALLLLGLGVALLSTALPFSLEHAALKRLPAHLFGVLMSLEPAIAALVGLVLLHQGIGSRGLLALLCITIAIGGSSRSNSPLGA